MIITGKRVSDSINIGASDVFVTPYNTNKEIYLGLTKDGATFKYESEYHDIQADQYGNMILDKILIGEKCNCEVKVLDTSKDSIYNTLSTAKKLGDGSIGFGQRPGLRASRHTCKVRIHPVSVGADNKEYDVIIYTAFNEAGLELAYKKDDEWVIPCKFIGIADLSREDGDLLFRIGEDAPSSSDTLKPIIRLDISPPNPAPISLSGLKENLQISFSATAVYLDGNTGNVTKIVEWSSSNPAIASIAVDDTENKAVATGLSVGRATITAKYGVNSYTSLVTVTE